MSFFVHKACYPPPKVFASKNQTCGNSKNPLLAANLPTPLENPEVYADVMNPDMEKALGRVYE